MNAVLKGSTTRADGKIVVGVADCAVANDSNAEIVTYALGSCIGVTAYDPVAKVGGMLHFMLPTALDETKGKEKPAMFGDTGVPLLFRSLYALGAEKGRLIVCAAGGAEVLDDNGHFRVGPRNRTILRKLFWKNNILLSADETGGNISRTVRIDLADGAVTVRHRSKEWQIWPH
ncbi:MAG: chemotaxis protein CheD [Planctomycetota bacterium]